MLDFIIENYYVILIICILLIFGVIGYIVDTLKNKKLEDNNVETYIPQEEVFIQNIENQEEEKFEESVQSTENLLEVYNNEKLNENSDD